MNNILIILDHMVKFFTSLSNDMTRAHIDKRSNMNDDGDGE